MGYEELQQTIQANVKVFLGRLNLKLDLEFNQSQLTPTNNAQTQGQIRLLLFFTKVVWNISASFSVESELFRS